MKRRTASLPASSRGAGGRRHDAAALEETYCEFAHVKATTDEYEGQPCESRQSGMVHLARRTEHEAVRTYGLLYRVGRMGPCDPCNDVRGVGMTGRNMDRIMGAPGSSVVRTGIADGSPVPLRRPPRRPPLGTAAAGTAGAVASLGAAAGSSGRGATTSPLIGRLAVVVARMPAARDELPSGRPAAGVRLRTPCPLPSLRPRAAEEPLPAAAAAAPAASPPASARRRSALRRRAAPRGLNATRPLPPPAEGI